MFLKTLTITISVLFLSSTTLAQTTPEGRATALEKGDKAPFAGTLLDPAAVAKILTDKKFAEEKCKLNTNKEKDLLNAKCKRDTDYLKAELEIEKKKHNLIVSAQKEEIETLRDLAKGSNNTFWAAIGFLLGAGSSIAIFYAATEIAK